MTQASALAIMKMGNNVFLTGSAGSGKTYVLNGYIRYLQEHQIEVAITASTGVAATHMGGMTIHAWSGIGIRDMLSDWDIEMMEEKKYLWDRYDKVKVLIIDEVSMLSGTFLDNLDRICRAFKRKDIPFGGIQVVLCGDLFQLPPITHGEAPVDFITDSHAWKTMGLAITYLTEQHRQNDDQFLTILNAIRANRVEKEHWNLLESRLREFNQDDFSDITKLFTHNVDVDTINHQQLKNIDEIEKKYVMTNKGRSNLVETLKKSCLAPEVLHLKIGAQVMFVKNNFDRGYVNGTRGTVIDYDDNGIPIVKTLEGEEIIANEEDWSIDDQGKVLATISQIPLRHAWAITIHKSQGMSLDGAVVDLSKAFTYGMGYVALSRIRSLDGLHLIGLSESSLAVDPKILALDVYLQNFSQKAESRLAEFSQEELTQSHHEFIARTGGKIQPIKISKKKGMKKAPKTKNYQVTYDLLKSGKSINEIAKTLDFVSGTIIGHLETAYQEGLPVSFSHIKPSSDMLEIIRKAFESVRDKEQSFLEVKLTPVKRNLEKEGHQYTFDEIRLARLFC